MNPFYLSVLTWLTGVCPLRGGYPVVQRFTPIPSSCGGFPTRHGQLPIRVSCLLEGTLGVISVNQEEAAFFPVVHHSFLRLALVATAHVWGLGSQGGSHPWGKPVTVF